MIGILINIIYVQSYTLSYFSCIISLAVLSILSVDRLKAGLVCPIFILPSFEDPASTDQEPSACNYYYNNLIMFYSLMISA